MNLFVRKDYMALEKLSKGVRLKASEIEEGCETLWRFAHGSADERLFRKFLQASQKIVWHDVHLVLHGRTQVEHGARSEASLLPRF